MTPEVRPESQTTSTLGNKLGNLLLPAQRLEPINTASCLQSTIESRLAERTYSGRAGALSFCHLGGKLLVSQGKHLALDSQVPALRLKVLLGFNGRLNKQRNRRASCKSQAGSHHQGGRAIYCAKRSTRPAHQLNEISRKVDVLVEPLTGEVEPVAVVDIEDQVVSHAYYSFMLEQAGVAEVGAEKEAPEFAHRQEKSYSWEVPRRSSCYLAYQTIATSGQPANNREAHA